MRKRFGWLFLSIMMIFSGLIIITGWTDDDVKVLLRFNSTKGKVYTITSTIMTQTLQTIKGKDMKVTLENVVKMKYIIDDVDADGIVTITATYTGIKIKQNGMQGVVEYDSESENPINPVPPAVKGLVALIGTSLTAKMDSRGKVLEIQGLDALLNKMLDNLGSDKNDPNVAKFLANFKKQFSDQSFKEMFQSMTAPYPEAPVGIGDSWKTTMTLTQIIPMILETTYTVKENKNGILVLDITSSMQPNGEASLDLGVAQLSYNISGDQEGTMEIQTASGMTLRSHAKQHLTGQMKMVSDKEKGANLTWPISMDSEISMEAIEEATP
jgi:hypothetical protein